MMEGIEGNVGARTCRVRGDSQLLKIGAARIQTFGKTGKTGKIHSKTTPVAWHRATP
jgi:hypothetical protein